MHHRVGSLHLHYRVSDGALSALTPALDRAIQSGLADALDSRLSAAFGDDTSVIVIRELKANVMLAGTDAMLDRRAVDRVCASSVDALANTLAHEASADTLVRYADEAEFVGSFIIDLLAGHAWEHWYYGAFHCHRRASISQTVREVLAQSADCARVLAWLARRGRLDGVLELLNGQELLAIAAPSGLGAGIGARDGAELLADAAIQLVTALGVHELRITRDVLLRQYAETTPALADWRDRRSLSAAVLQLVRFALERTSIAQRASATLSDAARLALNGPLDWLDGSWLIARLEDELSTQPRERAELPDITRSLLTPQQRHVLERITRHLREGGARIAAGRDEAEITVRLIALASEQLPPGDVLDHTLLATIRDIAHAYEISAGVHTHVRRESASDSVRDGTSRKPEATLAAGAAQRQALDRYAKAATDLLDVLITSHDTSELRIETTPAGGLFLLIRALMDMRLPALAGDFAITLPSLLGALAIKWFDVAQPFDAPTSLWVGSERADLSALDSACEHLDALNDALVETLSIRQGLEAGALRQSIESDSLLLSKPLPCSPALDAAASRTASALLRAWAYWLRGVSSSSTPFLLDNCLRRVARVRIAEEAINVELDPAPLDVVLRMAGYFDRIDCVPWLGNRRVTFSVRSRA